MESISERERILLGYEPRNTFGGGAASSPRWNSDVDFQDVFGGPPRRSSLYESRRGRADSVDLYRRASGCREDSVEFRRSHLQSGEKPVFGDASSSNRRRHLGDDFYNDIFQSSESACSSPRSYDQHPYPSPPNSRVLSPNRPTQLRCEPFFGGSSLPTQLRGMDHAAPGFRTQRLLCKGDTGLSDSFSSPSSPNASSVGFATQSVVGLGDPRNEGQFLYRQSRLSRRIPHGYEVWPESTKFSSPSNENKMGKRSSSLEAYIRNDQFHFSIYRWAGKGVTLVMPSYSKEENEYEGKLRRLPEVIVQEVELPPPFDYSSTVSKAFKKGTVTQENKPAYEVFAGWNEDDYASIIVNDVLLAESNHTLIHDDMNSKSDKCENLLSEVVSVPAANQNSETNIIREECNLDPDIIMHGHHNPELKSHSQLFDDDIGRQKNDHKTGQVKDTDALSIGRRNQQHRRERRPSYAEESSANMHDIPNFSEDESRGGQVKGKVKEFIKIFNHEASPKHKSEFDMLDRKSRGKHIRPEKVDEPVHSSGVKVAELQEKFVNNTSAFDIPKSMENQVIQKAEEDNSSINCDDHMINDLSFKERSETLNPITESSPEVPENAACNEEYVLEDIEGYLVQQLPSNQAELVQNGPQQDQIKNLDSKIRDWSKGKDGNIRSLLSTLQYILWPESGWKQVPLVDIIEGPSVRKAYQRALLCLHPDKLQQKGVSSNQKYIAEKVFDILQEAWDHFNSISQF